MDGERLRTAVEQHTAYLADNPEAGRGPDTPASATYEWEGLRMRVDGPDDWRVATDHVEAIGGGRTAPNPGWYWRASLASCDATVIVLRAAQLGIDLTTLEVTVESESDARGSTDLDDDVPAGPTAVHLHVRLAASNADADQLHELVEWTEDHSPVGHAISRPVPMDIDVTVE